MTSEACHIGFATSNLATLLATYTSTSCTQRIWEKKKKKKKQEASLLIKKFSPGEEREDAIYY